MERGWGRGRGRGRGEYDPWMGVSVAQDNQCKLPSTTAFARDSLGPVIDQEVSKQMIIGPPVDVGSF